MKNFFSIQKITIFLFFLMIIFWLGVVYSNSSRIVKYPAGDFQRDMSIIRNIRNGNIFGDNNYFGEKAWYPYLFHLIYAFLNLITGISLEKLIFNYPFIVTGITIFLLATGSYKLFRSLQFSLLTVFSFLFVIPWTSHHVHAYTHPFIIAFGTMALSIFLFHQAVTKNRIFDYIAAGFGISLVVFSQPFAAFTVCGGIVIYQLITRKNWRKFILMVFASFVFASPYLLPLIITYHLKSLNTLGVLYFSKEEFSLDNLLYGLGSIRYVNSFMILLGILVAFIRRRKLDIILLGMFFFSLLFVVWGVGEVYFPKFFIFSMIRLPKMFIWVDIMRCNHLIAVFLFSIGIWYFLEQISKIFAFTQKKKVFFILYLIFLCIYSYLMFPKFIEKAKLVVDLQKNTDFTYWEDYQKMAVWIKDNTSIYDVFAADPNVSYLYIGGLTGRKLVITYGSHCSPFVNQSERLYDYAFMNATSKVSDFLSLSKKYKVSYAVVSPYERQTAGEGINKFSDKSVFSPVYSSGSVTIYKLL